MLKIRLQRVGKKNSPSYRVVLAEHTAPPQGKFQEILGFYNPRSKEKSFKKERIEHWLSKGAQLSPTVHNLLVDEGILKGIKLKAWRPKKKKETPKESEKPVEAEKKEPEEEPKKEEEKKEEVKEKKPKEIEEKPVEKPEEAKAEEPEKKEEGSKKEETKKEKPKEEEEKKEEK